MGGTFNPLLCPRPSPSGPAEGCLLSHILVNVVGIFSILREGSLSAPVLGFFDRVL